MSDHPHRTLVHSRRHDLPPSWDGAPVTWDPWTETSTTLRFHTITACEQCGVINEPHVTHGLRTPEADQPRIRDLVAFRCPDCGHDRVLDKRSDELWDLEPHDYDAAGSTADGVLW